MAMLFHRRLWPLVLVCIVMAFRCVCSAEANPKKDIYGTQVYFLLEAGVTNGNVEEKCRDVLGASFSQYEPGTNDDVTKVIDILDQLDETGYVWVKSRFDPGKDPVDAFSWRLEPVSTKLWFSYYNLWGSKKRSEPDDVTPCTLLRKTRAFVSSSTGKHMLGNKDCGVSAKCLCVDTLDGITTQPTTELTTSTSAPIIETTQPPPPTTTAPDIITENPATTQEISTESDALTLTITTEPPKTTQQLTIISTQHTTQQTNTHPQTTTHGSPLSTTQHIPEDTTSPHPASSATSCNTTLEDTTISITEKHTSKTSGKTSDSNQKSRQNIPKELESILVLVCPCACPNHTTLPTPPTNASTTEWVQTLTHQIQNNLTLTSGDLQGLSTTVRKKTSAKDDRPTSQIGGVMAVVIVTLTFGAIAVSDVFTHFGLMMCKHKTQ